ncbi:Rieske (2Fe-2S) protein [Fibrella aquatica]|uniref:Rieske (2Fe-2S) protein n=1 Tax=Fibrella aquatica TaxID=3242487 RepID=UPI00352290DB
MSHSNATPQDESVQLVSRGEFMRSLGMSSAALMAFYCLGTLSSCSKGDDPAPVVTPPVTGGNSGLTGNSIVSSGAIDFTMDLTNSTYSGLKTAGNFVSVGDVIVFNAGGTYRALGRICTHQGGSLSFRSGSNDLVCSLHQATYTTDGSPKSQPVGGGTITAVKSYNATLTGDKLQVKG